VIWFYCSGVSVLTGRSANETDSALRGTGVVDDGWWGITKVVSTRLATGGAAGTRDGDEQAAQ
jgi:hypothetical protein